MNSGGIFFDEVIRINEFRREPCTTRYIHAPGKTMQSLNPNEIQKTLNGLFVSDVQNRF
jgi:hypothetical protein